MDKLEQVQPQDWLVLELSSFQLELFDGASYGQARSPHLEAAVLNVTPNHLDRHPGMAHYTAAKANILRWQGPDDVAVLGADDAVTGGWLRASVPTSPPVQARRRGALPYWPAAGLRPG